MGGLLCWLFTNGKIKLLLAVRAVSILSVRRDSSVRLKICTSPGGVHARVREIPIPRLPSVLLVHERVHVALAKRALHAALEPPVNAPRVVRVQAREVAQRLTLGVVLEADGASRVVLA